MTNFEGIKKWSDVLVLEDGDVLKGGVDGLANVQAKALVDRTEYLKEELLEVKEQTAGLGPNMGGSGEGGGGNLPAGTIIAFGGTTAPAGFLECNGATLSRKTFAGLFAAIGTVWGEPSPTTFKIPNFTEAERFLRSRSESLPVGTLQGDAIRNITSAIQSKILDLDLNIDGNIKSYGALYKTGIMTGAGVSYANPMGSHGMLGFDASKAPGVNVADENRPKSAVVMYCIKASDSVVDPEQLLAQGVVEEVANKADRSEVKELAGSRLWVSGEHQPILNTPTIVTHGLNIDPLRCRYDVLLKCVDNDNGYSIGDTTISPITQAYATVNSTWTTVFPLVSTLSSNTVQINTGYHGVYSLHKANGTYGGLTLTKWRYIFRIWY